MQGQVVITGATGVIGAEIVAKLAARGEAVVVLARSPESAERNVPGARKYVRWDSDMQDGEWREYIDGAKAVIHLAGKPLLETRWTPEHKKECYDSRILGTRHIVDAIAHAAVKPGVLISASAVGYYGSFDRCDDTPGITESGKQGRDFLAEICVDWEREALKAEGVRLVLLRTGIVLSSKGGMLEKLLGPFNMFVGGPVGSGNQCISWIHLDDEIDAILAALDHDGWHGPINLVSPRPVSMREFADTLGSVLGRPALLAVPKLAVKLLLGEGGEYAASGQKVVPAFLQEKGYAFHFTDLSVALKDLIDTGR
ncbi:TIGR01777 family protein [Chlorobium phaeovibrioides]|uniref:TIGR01777 family protein n=2 Tax=Chlorobium phaeovibrioides TaxID=1094 RepID=A0A5M8I8Q8_CHLPH|nr:TIGR01777 family oxidoreductase [Chlorobium phaeovibrioides]KAA6231823.1 TIGR01777 family protein [Chlorobium phaeovibrioides]MWV54178.1 TIGR01777 family protein [Chlorobium phaeovibrioides]RTY34618.1 TIGR01777 family protein [Chlorobium phaeovibrioides]HCD36882.1 TIGR01777 family protein [Chlorobium sp.]